MPTTSCTPGTPCGCGRTITLSDADYPDMRMPFQHGTLAWEASYHRRVGIESVFADLKKNRLGVHRGYFRGFGIRRYTLLAKFTLAALNILNLHDWATRREVLDGWGAVPRRTGTRTPTPTAAAQHPIRDAPRSIVGRHGTGQMTTRPRRRNLRIPAIDRDHRPKMTNYHAPVQQMRR
ncbi:hypothetical protein FXW78_23305 [Rhodococcus opacus]|nr:hypothetical protein [Rhodococcus opacus]